MTHVFRKGDIVRVVGEVAYDHRLTEDTITVLINGTTAYLKANALTLERASFRRGEAVFVSSVGDATVLGQEGGDVWVRFAEGTTTVVDHSDVTLKVGDEATKQGAA